MLPNVSITRKEKVDGTAAIPDRIPRPEAIKLDGDADDGAILTTWGDWLTCTPLRRTDATYSPAVRVVHKSLMTVWSPLSIFVVETGTMPSTRTATSFIAYALASTPFPYLSRK